MNIGLLIQSILASIGAIAVNPAFGIAGAAAKILPLLGIVTTVVAEGIEVEKKLKAFDDQLKQINAENRAPTDDEWAAWDERHQAAKARLQS